MGFVIDALRDSPSRGRSGGASGPVVRNAIRSEYRVLTVTSNKGGVGKTTLAVLEALASHLARLHEAGFYYRDLHSENILLHVPGEGAPSVYFVDLHEVRNVGTIRRWMCVDDLGRLSGYTVIPACYRVAFLKTYLAERGLAAEDWKAWARDVDRRTREIWARFYRKRGRRIDTY